MKGIYFDNGATSFPKPGGVAESMCKYITEIGSNIGRGAYGTSYQAEEVVLETRELICELFRSEKPENVIFTKNITESLNVIIKGLMNAGDHVIVSSMEHNAVMRPLHSKHLENVEISHIECSVDGTMNPEDLFNYIKPNTKAVIMTHASNVCGTILPLERIGQICKEKDIYFIVDAAQTAGVIDLDFVKIGADAIGFTGHKSLLGPQGMGGFIVTDELAKVLDTFIEGGTGSKSDSEFQPDYMPDKFEAGTMNLPGVYGLNAALKYLKQKGIESIRTHELELTRVFLEAVLKLDHVRVIGKKDMSDRTAVVSLDFFKEDNGLVSYKLEKDFGIKTRCGLHCAPLAHKTLDTFPKGTVRFSFGYSNTLEEIYSAIEAIKECKDL